MMTSTPKSSPDCGHKNLRLGCAAILVLASWLFLVSPALAAGITVPAGASLHLDGGSMDLGCGDLSVQGTTFADTSTIQNIAAVDVAATGALDGDSASFIVSGDWNNTGSFSPGTSVVTLTDGCQSSTTITGNSTFHDLVLDGTTGRSFQFEAGSTQTITHSVTILATPGTLVSIASTVPGIYAELALGPGVTVNNANPSSIVWSWIISPLVAVVTAVPALSGTALALLVAALLWVGVGRLRRRNQ